jgi:hypothetical protein
MARLAARSGGLVISVRRWTTPVFYAGRTTPRRTVTLTASWAPRTRLLGVPIPRNAAPDPAGDGHMTVLDLRRGCEYDLFRARKRAGGAWAADWANRIELSGDGIYSGGLSARGSGFATLAGVILPEELRDGAIRHALLFSYPYVRGGGPVLPATESDGTSAERYALPDGARLQLDPSFDVDSLPAGWQRTVARALQRYGMILGDTGSGAVSLYAVNPLGRPNPYPWGSGAYAYLPAEIVARLRVLRLPPQYRPRHSLAASRCGSFG